MSTSPPSFDCAPFIREIGRGARGARGLSREDAFRVYEAILAGRVSAVEMGAVLMAYRIKGETAEELAGMCEAAHASITTLRAPAGRTPVVIASYNGARKQANLVALLALLLSRSGIPVLIHGVRKDPGRVTTSEVLEALGIAPAQDAAMAQGQLADRGLAFLETAALAPALASQLALRSVLGVRNSAHTVVKLLQPFDGPALRLVNYTHPPYRDMLIEFFGTIDPVASPGVLLARGTEGEAVADATLARETLWIHDGVTETVIEKGMRMTAGIETLPASREAAATAEWIGQVLADTMAVPAPIAAQVAGITRVLRGG
jgi:anthranilate phosphoribosyltransferase